MDITHADLAADAALAWSRWVLAATSRALQERVGLDEVLKGINGYMSFHRGELPEYLAQHRLTELAEDDQRNLGLAVGRRWSVNGTFNVRNDVIEPLAVGKTEYPPAFSGGVLEGLLLDSNGYIRARADDIRLAAGIAERLPGDRRGRVLAELVDRVQDSLVAYTFDAESQDAAVATLREIAAQHGGSTGTAFEAVARRIEDLRAPD